MIPGFPYELAHIAVPMHRENRGPLRRFYHDPEDQQAPSRLRQGGIGRSPPHHDVALNALPFTAKNAEHGESLTTTRPASPGLIERPDRL